MAETETPKSDAPEAAAPEAATPAAPAPAEAAQTRQQPVQVQVNDDQAHATYANFCRVTGSPEELIVDFGLNPQPIGVPKEPIKVNQRIILNFYTAKRLLAALQMSVARHEAVFGVLETDINKRVRPQNQPGGKQQQQQ
ncbi:DUF3467 domain-containing protein [Candidatus Laterigemmans baculatus]|uniref:DUF3467 domain-containing protein n=1 Tax=Candidatus Laterigemmans baculatus TaxID=2770505 RepID=UPI0013D9BBBA|nr:DUF3467 domain-containing protein [Candidatus Laterigemmans baculatus]